MLLLPVMVLSLLACVHFANKTYRTFLILYSARTLEIPEAGNIRAWMTIEYISKSYRIRVVILLGKLGLPPDTASSKTLRALSEEAGVEPLSYVQLVQKALAEISAKQVVNQSPEAQTDGWLEQLADDIFSALLVNGYPVLVIILFLGALGLPVPAGPLTAVAGTLAMQGEINWLLACALAVTASVSGDLGAYAAGRLLGPRFWDRWGHWVGYTKANRQRLDKLYQSWGGLTLILTRSLVAYIGAIASILAGAGRYHLDRFLAFSVIGRVIWTASYFGLGYAVGSDFEVASGFLGYLSMFLIMAAVSVGSGTLLLRIRRARAQ